MLKVSDIDSVEIGEDGKIKDADKLQENIKSEWADFIVSQGTKGAETATPPTNNGAKDTDDNSAVNKIIAQRANMYGALKD